MDDRVKKMVDRLFDGTEDNEEMAAAKAEILENCQERYADLAAEGMNDDDVMRAVEDSLKGMEELLDKYPGEDAAAATKVTETEETEEDENGDVTLRFDAMEITSVRANLRSMSIRFETSPGTEALVIYPAKVRKLMSVTAKDGVLSIQQKSRTEVEGESTVKDISRDAQELFDKNQWSAEDVTGFLSSTFQRALGGVSKIFSAPVDAKIKVYLPAGRIQTAEIGTTSGDIVWDEISVSESMKIGTTSGDAAVTLGAKCAEVGIHCTSGDVTFRGEADTLDLSTTNGDIEAEASAEKAALSTTSGDLKWTGSAAELDVTTVNGDADLRGETGHVEAQSVNGDLDVTVDAENCDMELNTVTGDITVRTPAEKSVRAETSTTRGDAKVRRETTDSEEADIQIRAESVNGDIVIG